MQLYDREVIRPRGKDEMTDEEREAALQYLMFLKQKRDGTVKEEAVQTAENSDHTPPRKRRVHQRSQLSQSCYHAQLTPRKREMWGGRPPSCVHAGRDGGRKNSPHETGREDG
ncbi:hypothetical protein MHU86_19210 [Fragilaria crotonensis]|nr:hypothetical protein MHU86_19210 [Fragilaria crotonensis]